MTHAIAARGALARGGRELRRQSALRAAPRVASGAALLSGGVVLLGWHAGNARLIGAVPGLAGMNPATAMSFMLAGLSLGLATAQPAGRWRRGAARALGLVVAAVGLVRLGAYAVGTDGVVDELLFRNRLVDLPFASSRMAPNTALAFLLLGLALALLERRERRARAPAEVLALGVAVIAILAVTGYAYAEGRLLRVGSFAPMALNTAATFAVLSVGTLCARPDRGMMALLTSDTGAGLTARRLLAASIAIPWTIGWLCLRGEMVGLYGTEFGMALFAVAAMGILTGVTWWTSRTLAGAEAQRAQDEAALRRSAAEIEDLYNNAPCGYHSLDPDGVFVRINDTELRWLGYRRDELVGRARVTAVLTPESARRVAETFPLFKERGAVSDLELELVRKDGSILPVLISATAVVDADGRFVMSRSSVFDNTTRKRAEQDVLRLNAELEQRALQVEAANRDLEAFSYSVSHDLRAPLRAIDGFGRILLEEHGARLDGEGQRVLGVIRENARRMSRLIEDLLAFSRLGRKPLESTRVDMAALARGVVEEMRSQQPGRQVAVEIATLPPASGDLALLNEVLANLIGNAWKFTRGRSQPAVEIGFTPGNDETTYWVRDNGAGFDMRFAGKLFGVFQRLHAEAEFEGTGVGLALVQRIIQRHGGRVWGEGEVGRGATFYFTLPAPREGRDEGTGSRDPAR